MRSENLGYIFALAAGIIWGFLGLFVREMYAVGFNSMQMTCLRYIIVFVVLLSYALLFNRSVFRIDWRILILLALVGIVGNAVNSSCYFGAMERISLSLSTILQYSAPFIVLLLSVPLLGEKLTGRKVVAVAMAFGGCILCTGLISEPGNLDVLGIALGAVSGICFALYTIGSKKASSLGQPAFKILFYSSIACALFLMPLCDFPSAVDTTFHSGYNLMLVIGLGLSMTLLPFGLYNLAISHADVGKVSIITYIEPVVATLVGLAFYGEDVTADIILGIILVMFALIIVNLNRHKTVAEQDDGCR